MEPRGLPVTTGPVISALRPDPHWTAPARGQPAGQFARRGRAGVPRSGGIVQVALRVRAVTRQLFAGGRLAR
jgi:hypothetical protein